MRPLQLYEMLSPPATALSPHRGDGCAPSTVGPQTRAPPDFSASDRYFSLPRDSLKTKSRAVAGTVWVCLHSDAQVPPVHTSAMEKNMKPFDRIGVASLGALGIVFAGAQTSMASSVPAMLGQAQQASEYSCFSNSNGGVRNECSSSKRFCVALPADTGPHAVVANVFAPANGPLLKCHALAVDRARSGGTSSGDQPIPQLGVNTQIDLHTMLVPENGGLYVCCDLPPQAWLNTIKY